MISTPHVDHLPGMAFDSIADSYDSLFTTSVIGRSQRAAVCRKAASVFRSGDRVLELNCGTGEDALFLAQKGVFVTACDASSRMIERARARKTMEAPTANVDFQVLRSEDLAELSSPLYFDGVFSNFSGLNCIADLMDIARLLSARLKIGAQLLLCLSSRFCVWEMLHYVSRGEFRKAFRRCGGFTQAQLGQYSLPVYYPTLRSVLRSFGLQFRLLSVTGIGIAVPPSYMEPWARKHSSIFRMCESVDRALCRCPGIRILGDHMLLHMERV